MSSKPTILLDVDGVVNIVNSREEAARLWDGKIITQYIEHTEDRRGNSGYTVNIATDVINTLNFLNELGGIEVKWLTTWVHNTKELCTLGVPDFYFLERPVHESDNWWKWDVVKNLVSTLDEDTPILWIDDEHGYDPNVVRWLLTDPAAESIEVISPDTFEGLTPEHLLRIRKWATSQIP